MLSLKFKKRLRFFTLEVELEVADEILVLAGPSGAGKTMTLEVLAGLTHPEEGLIRLHDRVFFSSHDRVNLPPERRQMGYLFQEYALFPHLSVKRNVMYAVGRRCKKESGYRFSVLDIMGLFKITHLQSRYPREISGGEKQRVALARALMGEPDLLLLDEPLNALDTVTRQEMRLQLLEIRKNFRIPCIYVTHDLNEAALMGDRVAFMERGRITRVVPASELARPLTSAPGQPGSGQVFPEGGRSLSQAPSEPDHVIKGLNLS